MDPGNGAAGTSYTLKGDSDANNKAWILNSETTKFGLDFDANVGSGSFSGFYIPANSVNGNSDYYRKIVLTRFTTPPYDKNIGPYLEVQSFVWWIDKKCPRAADWAQANPACRVEIDSYLTNWKDYEVN
jgi:hypothetical protein